MNILLSATAYPPSVGGAQNYAHETLKGLMARGHRIRVASQWDEVRRDWLLGTTLRAPFPAHAYIHEGVAVQRITIPPTSRGSLLAWVCLYYVFQGAAIDHISDALLTELLPYGSQVDLVHNVRIGREGLSFASWKLARRASVPFILSPIHHPRWTGWMHRAFHRLYCDADGLIALTEAEKRTLVQLGVESRRVFVTGMGPVLAESADGSRFRKQYGLMDYPVILFLGQKYPYKGIRELLDSARIVWESHPDARFLFIGPRTDFSRKLFMRIDDPRILELGTVDLQEKTNAIQACDVLCLPSTQESFGAVFVEAWMHKKPVIGGSIPAIRAVVDHGRDGFLVAQNAGALAESIARLLRHPDLRIEFGSHGYQKAIARYTWPRLVELTEEAYLATVKNYTR